VREKPIMARHHRMPPEAAGYTYAVEPTATNRLLANEEESIYRHSNSHSQWSFYGYEEVPGYASDLSIPNP